MWYQTPGVTLTHLKKLVIDFNINFTKIEQKSNV